MSWNIPLILMVTVPFLNHHGCNQTESRIMHGNHLRIDEAPWTIGLVSTLTPPDQIEFILGTGTILSKNYVLTAAHIFFPMEPGKGITNTKDNSVIRYATAVLAQSEGLFEVIQEVHMHPQFKSIGPAHAQFDVAVLKTEYPMEMGPRTAVAKTISNPKDTYGVGSICLLTGFGMTGYSEIDLGPPKLRTTELYIHPTESCKQYVPMAPRMFCAFKDNSGACEADSGAPLICGGNLYAIHIRGMVCLKEFDMIIGQYLRLSIVKDFIQKKTNGEAMWDVPF